MVNRDIQPERGRRVSLGQAMKWTPMTERGELDEETKKRLRELLESLGVEEEE